MKKIDIKKRVVSFERNLLKLHEFATEAALGKLLQELMDRCELLTIFHDPDDDTFSATVMSDSGQTNGVGDDMLSALLVAMGCDKFKRCMRCKTRKTPTAFSKLASSPDGRNKFCRECERERVKQYKRGSGHQGYKRRNDDKDCDTNDSDVQRN